MSPCIIQIEKESVKLSRNFLLKLLVSHLVGDCSSYPGWFLTVMSCVTQTVTCALK